LEVEFNRAQDRLLNGWLTEGLSAEALRARS
jgi:hypothetical protein